MALSSREDLVLAVVGGACLLWFVGAVIACVRTRRAGKAADRGRWATWRDEPRALGEVKDNEDPPRHTG